MSWATTFARFRPGSMPLIGPVIVRVADWSKPVPGTAPMFDHPPLLERFSVAHPAFPFAVYAPVGIALVWRGWHNGMSALGVTAAYLAGLFVWSLLEYGRTAARSTTRRRRKGRSRTGTWCTACTTRIRTIHGAG